MVPSCCSLPACRPNQQGCGGVSPAASHPSSSVERHTHPSGSAQLCSPCHISATPTPLAPHVAGYLACSRDSPAPLPHTHTYQRYKQRHHGGSAHSASDHDPDYPDSPASVTGVLLLCRGVCCSVASAEPPDAPWAIPTRQLATPAILACPDQQQQQSLLLCTCHPVRGRHNIAAAFIRYIRRCPMCRCAGGGVLPPLLAGDAWIPLRVRCRVRVNNKR